MKKRLLIALAFLFPLYLCAQFAYALIVREPYPSFMLPGFSRIDNNTETYTLADKVYNLTFENGETKKYDIADLNTGLSKIAIGRVIDLAYFEDGFEKTYNSKQKKYYQIIEDIVGTETYKKHIIAVRNPKMTPSQKEKFTSWLISTFEETLSQKISSLRIDRIKVLRDFKKGTVLNTTITDSNTITP